MKIFRLKIYKDKDGDFEGSFYPRSA